jgi:hypothetical protein
MLDGLHDPGVKLPSPVLEQTPVGHVVGQGVLEGVLEVRKEPRLIEELGGLKSGETAAERLLRFLDDGVEEREGHVLAEDGRRLQEALVLRRETVDARGHDSCIRKAA